MPVVAVVNRKGGSGKSTLATHLAVYCAKSGYPVMLGDTDRNQSTQVWMRARTGRRLPPSASLVGRAVDPRNLLRTPSGTEHVVLDTPGGLHGFELGRVVCHADALIIPVCGSLFDRDSAAECWAELKQLPRVSSGRCKVAVVGMRMDERPKAESQFRQWAASQDLPVIGVLRSSRSYVKSIEHGLTLFDLPPGNVAGLLQQWEPIIEWLRPVLDRKAAPVETLSRPCYRPPERSQPEKPLGITIPGALLPDLPVPKPAAAPLRPRVETVQPVYADSWGQRLGRLMNTPLSRLLVGRH